MKQQNPYRLLIIDDNPAVHDDFKRILGRPSKSATMDLAEKVLFEQAPQAIDLPLFQIDCATQGGEALAMALQAIEEDRPYALAFIDIRMPPGWDGVETLRALWEHDPTLQAVICSAYSDYSWERIATLFGCCDNLLILKKPFDPIEVLQVTHAMTKKWQLSQKVRVELEASQRLTSMFFDHTTEAIIICDANQKVIAINPAFTHLTGYALGDANDIIQRVWSSLYPEGGPERGFWEQVIDTGNWQGELVLLRKDGTSFPARLCINAVKNALHRLAHYLYIISDITPLKDHQKQLEYLASYDSLTGLPNRNLFFDRLHHAIDKAKRENKRCAIAFIDLDNFKYVNDTLGHPAGDQLLTMVTERLRVSVREEDTLCRFGGDEFAVLLEGIVGEEHVAKTMQRITSALKQPFLIDANEFYTTASIGIALYPDDGLDVDTLVKNSDTAMYKAKENGKNGYRFFTASMNQDVTQRLFLEAKLRQALERNEFFLLYQPQVKITNNTIVGIEALLRWRTTEPDNTMLGPGSFIRVAEISGLIAPIGQWVVEESCRQIQQWLEMGVPINKVSINLSARQFQQRDLPTLLATVLANTGLAAHYLELEITEDSLMQEPEVTTRVIKELKAMGLTIAIDDFGSGYSSLVYLKRFPIDKLKIDHSFVRDIVTDPDAATIISAIINLAHSLGIKVIAEGVENTEQLQFLRAQGCDEAQGFYFGRPCMADEIPALFHTGLLAMAG